MSGKKSRSLRQPKARTKKDVTTRNVRKQAFEGLVLAVKHGAEAGATFTVRRVASGVGVEKIFPLYSPNVDSVEVLRRAQVRRAKLYFIRRKAAKEAAHAMRKARAFTPAAVAEQEVSAEPAIAPEPVVQQAAE